MPLHWLVCEFDQEIDAELRLDELAFSVGRLTLMSSPVPYDTL
jgi:hypothetical protein